MYYNPVTFAAVYMLSKFILTLLDLIYPYFKRLMPVQTFRYAACGGGNTLLGLTVFFVSYNYGLQKQMMHLPFVTISPHIVAMLLSFLVTFPLGFYLARNVVFSGSVLRGRQQLARYFATALGSVFFNYINLKILVDMLHFYPTISQIINTVIVIVFSYLMQKYFAFKPAKKVIK